MTIRDTTATDTALRAFQSAWELTNEDYSARRINSEHCVQAALYRYLAALLPETFRIYVEAVVQLRESGIRQTGKRRIVIDLLVCQESTVVAAIEIKFAPRGEPNHEHVRKDLTSLALITNRRSRVDGVDIQMPRFHARDVDQLEVAVSPYRKLIFAAFCAKEANASSPQDFWRKFAPRDGYWAGRGSIPPNLAVALALTTDDGTAETVYFGQPFTGPHDAQNTGFDAAQEC